MIRVWLILVASTNGFGSSVYAGQRGYHSKAQCIRALERAKDEVGYGGICTTMRPFVLSPGPWDRWSEAERADQAIRFEKSIIATTIEVTR
jgi:hypothetical protein